MNRLGKPDRAENGEASSKGRMFPYMSLRVALREEVWRENWANQFVRPGLLLIAVFEIGSIALARFHFIPRDGIFRLNSSTLSRLSFACGSCGPRASSISGGSSRSASA